MQENVQNQASVTYMCHSNKKILLHWKKKQKSVWIFLLTLVWFTFLIINIHNVSVAYCHLIFNLISLQGISMPSVL